jgi:hypothetical protein
MAAICASKFVSKMIMSFERRRFAHGLSPRYVNVDSADGLDNCTDRLIKITGRRRGKSVFKRPSQNLASLGLHALSMTSRTLPETLLKSVVKVSNCDAAQTGSPVFPNSLNVSSQ